MKKKLLLYSGIALILVCTIFLIRYCSKYRIDINSAISMEVVSIIDSFDYSLFEVSFTNHTDHHITFGNLSTFNQKSIIEKIRSNKIVKSFLPFPHYQPVEILHISFDDGFSTPPATGGLPGFPRVTTILWSIPPKGTITAFFKFFPLRVYEEGMPITIHYPFLFLMVDGRSDTTTRHELISKPIPGYLYRDIKTIVEQSSIPQ